MEPRVANRPFLPWLSQAARSRAHDQVRRKRLAQWREVGPELDSVSLPSQRLGGGRATVASYLASLPEADRVILEAFASTLGKRGWVEGAANALGFKPEAVRQRKKRLVEKLKERLEVFEP